MQQTSSWTNPRKTPVGVNLRPGDRVLVQGTFSGTVKYVGDLDSEYTKSELYVGVKLDDPGQ